MGDHDIDLGITEAHSLFSTFLQFHLVFNSIF